MSYLSVSFHHSQRKWFRRYENDPVVVSPKCWKAHQRSSRIFIHFCTYCRFHVIQRPTRKFQPTEGRKKINTGLDKKSVRIFRPVQATSARQVIPCVHDHHNTYRWLFEYNRLVFGLKIALATFQQSIETCLSGLMGWLSFLTIFWLWVLIDKIITKSYTKS